MKSIKKYTTNSPERCVRDADANLDGIIEEICARPAKQCVNPFGALKAPEFRCEK